jgi:tetratricopeptide (TPR) repeat protein
MAAKFTRTVLVAVALLRSGVAVAQPLDRDAYDRALTTYVTGGDVTTALIPLQRWSKQDFEQAIDRIISTKDRGRMEEAAVFQLEIGVGIVTLSTISAAEHFDFGTRVLAALTPPPSQRTPQLVNEIQQFQETWFGVAGSAFMAVNEGLQARSWIRRGLRVAPKSPVLSTLEGEALELEAGVYLPIRARAVNMTATRRDAERRRLLVAAADAYRAAVELDPKYALAQVRLGRLLHVMNDTSQATTLLERGLAIATEPAHQYLGSLFLGLIKQEQDDLAGARVLYQRALEIVPRSQTATVALAYLETLSGRPDQAQALARSFAAETSDDRNWWAYKNGGLHEIGLRWLRSRISK